MKTCKSLVSRSDFAGCMCCYLFLIFALAASFANAETFYQLPAKIFELPVEGGDEISRNADVLIAQAEGLNARIGRYPPVFYSEFDREGVYLLWSELLGDAVIFNKTSRDSETSLFLLSQLYRQGHNMDVRNAAQKANEVLAKCLDIYPASIPCHFEASYFYLQISPTNTALARKSLVFLKKQFRKNSNENVESGFVFLHLYSGENKKAVKQIKSFIKAFPESARIKSFVQIKDAIESKEFKTMHTDFGG
jgi:hypothetical protein